MEDLTPWVSSREIELHEIIDSLMESRLLSQMFNYTRI